jgi:hypothetical protein
LTIWQNVTRKTAVETLNRQVQKARRRLILESFLRKLTWCWFGALLVAVVAIGAAKLWPPAVAQQSWAISWATGCLVVGILTAAGWTYWRRESALSAALEIDRRFGLKERVSTTFALPAADRNSSAAQALIQDAEQRLRGIDVSEKFRPRLGRKALLPLVPALIAFLVALVEPVSPTPAPAKPTAARQAPPPVKHATKALAKRLEERKKELAEQGLQEAETISKLEDGVKRLAEKPKSTQKETLLALNELVKDAEQRRHELANSADLKKQLAGLKNLQQGAADRMADALQQGQLDKAVEELSKLKEQLAAGKLDDAAKQQLAKQLDELKEQLARQAKAQEKQKQQLKEQLEAHRREGNREAAEQVQQQLDQLAAKQHHGNLSEMAAQLGQAAQSLNEGDAEAAAEALQGLGDQLAGLEQNLQEMEGLDAALEGIAECKKAMACGQCNGEGCAHCQGGDGGNWEKHFGKLGLERHRGGGKGIGVGLGPGLGKETNPDGKFYDSAVKQQPGVGAAKVVGEAGGANRKGVVRQEIQTEFTEADQNSAEALSDQRLPHDYRDHARDYFDSLRDGP